VQWGVSIALQRIVFFTRGLTGGRPQRVEPARGKKEVWTGAGFQVFKIAGGGGLEKGEAHRQAEISALNGEGRPFRGGTSSGEKVREGKSGELVNAPFFERVPCGKKKTSDESL